MMSAVATGGTLVRPHVIKLQGRQPTQVPVSATTFRVVQDALRLAVEQGTGQQADLEHFIAYCWSHPQHQQSQTWTYLDRAGLIEAADRSLQR